MKASRDFSVLIDIMARLRDPDTGCPWDVEQDFKSIRHFTIEEAYEVSDAIERENFEDLCSELGDLLLQPVFHAQMAAEAEHFDIGDVVEAITGKLIRRHPHIFDRENSLSSGDVVMQWEQIKEMERADRAQNGSVHQVSHLEDVPRALPGLLRAEKLSKQAAKVGFDWPDMISVMEKCREELDEVEAEIEKNNPAGIQEEIGDLLFSVVNLARKAGISAEAAMGDANAKFVRRFAYIEHCCVENDIELADAGLDQLQEYWQKIRDLDKRDGENSVRADE